MKSARMVSLVLVGGVIAGGLALDAGDDPDAPSEGTVVEAGVAMPAARPGDALSSTWYCAGGSATEGGIADHVVLIANYSDAALTANVTPLAGTVAPEPVEIEEAAGGDTTTTAAAESTTTTETTTTEPTTTTAVEPPPTPTPIEVPAASLVSVALSELIDAPLAGAVIEVDGGEVAVEHEITGDGGRATAACATSAAAQWTFPWGETLRGTRELLVFMNPFPDDATVDINLATDEGTREPLRFQGFVVPGRSVVGAFLEQDTRRAQVSAQVDVKSGRLVVDRIQTFDGTDPAREGITLGLGAPTPAERWTFPDGLVDEGITEQVVVFNPNEEVAEVEVEVRLDDPESIDVPEPFELTIPPLRYSIVDLGQPDEGATADAPKRIPDGVPHSLIVRSLNGVAVAAERVVTAAAPNRNVGISATLGSPLAAPTWYLPGGGVTDERSEVVTLFNTSDAVVSVDVSSLSGGAVVPIESLQAVEVQPGARRSFSLRDHGGQREELPLVVQADGPIVAERRLSRVGGRGLVQTMGIPLDVDVVVPDPLSG